MFEHKRFTKAIRQNDVDAARALLEKHPHFATIDVKGSYTKPLYYALRSRSDAMRELLIEYGAHPANTISGGSNALFVSIEMGNLAYVGMFAEKYPELLETKRGFGEPPIVTAARCGYIDIVMYLISKGLNPQEKDPYNRTALYYARENKREDIIGLLLPYHEAEMEATRKKMVTEQKVTASSTETWNKLSDMRIAHVVEDTVIGYRLTDIYNFAASERTRLAQNIVSKQETMETRRFEDLFGDAELSDAARRLDVALDDHGGFVPLTKKALVAKTMDKTP